MKSVIYMLIGFGLVLTSCKNANPASSDQAINSDAKSFGATIDNDGSLAFNEALEKLQTADSLQMKVTGVVTEVCQAKGCWMNVVAGAGEAKPMFVKFKDYAFFVPKDCAGKKVVMEGVAYRELTPVDELRHYAMDKGASKEEIEKITEPKEELKFMASGVLLYEK